MHVAKPLKFCSLYSLVIMDYVSVCHVAVTSLVTSLCFFLLYVKSLVDGILVVRIITLAFRYEDI